MKIIRYPQSCLVIEHQGRTIAIDPGNSFLDSHDNSELDTVEAVLYTHKHGDHLEPEIVEYLSDRKVPIFCNRETAEAIGDRDVHIIEDGQSFEAASFTIVARDLPHCLLPDGSAGPQNTGYVINKVLFHPGDGKELANLKVQAVALPIQGPDISMLDAFNFAKQLGVTTAIPIHYDVMGAKPTVFKQFAEMMHMPFNLIVLADGESLEL